MVELSGLEVMVISQELGRGLEGSYIAGVYSSGENQILRFRRPGGEETWAVASPRYGAWLSKKVSERGTTTEFTSKLRGEIERLRFARSAQVDLDRIFDLTLGEDEELKHVIVEMMPPGNILVTDDGWRVRLLLREVRSEKRRLVKGDVYSPPHQTRKSPGAVTSSEVEEMLASEKTLGRAIGKNVSLPRKYVREVLTRLGFDETTPTHGLEGRSGELASTLRSLVEEAIEKPTPSVCSTPEGEEIYVVRPTGLERKRQSSSVCELCDELLLPMMMGESAREPQAGELRRREAEATIDRLRRQEKENKERAARLREAAEKARAAPSLEEALKIVESAGEKRERGRAPSSREAAASILFERAKGLEKNAQDAATAAARLAGRLERKKPSEKPQTARLARRTVEWYEKFRWFFTSAGKLALGGRDAQSNGLLVKRHLEEGDTVYHADLFGSPFFVLKGGRAQSDQEVMEVSQATVSFSSAWKTGLGSADAYWVYKDQVSSSAPSGEYLPKGSFLIRGKKNFVQHNLVQLVAGLDEKGRVVCGPESAVARAAMCHVVLTPHREKPSETAKKVARELVKLSGSDLRLSVDDVLRALPPGGAKIVREKARPRSQIPTGGNL